MNKCHNVQVTFRCRKSNPEARIVQICNRIAWKRLIINLERLSLTIAIEETRKKQTKKVFPDKPSVLLTSCLPSHLQPGLKVRISIKIPKKMCWRMLLKDNAKMRKMRFFYTTCLCRVTTVAENKKWPSIIASLLAKFCSTIMSALHLTPLSHVVLLLVALWTTTFLFIKFATQIIYKEKTFKNCVLKDEEYSYLQKSCKRQEEAPCHCTILV